MKILGNLDYLKERIFFNDELRSAKDREKSQVSRTQQHSMKEKKRKIATTSKQIIEYPNTVVQEYKQNELTKEKVLNQLQQLDKLNSNIDMFITPFGLNNNKYLQDTPVFVKSQNKNHHTEVVNISKQLIPYNSVNNDEMKNQLQKVVQNKLNNLITGQNKLQNKRKSVSYRIHIPPKQFNFVNHQESKKSINQIIPLEFQNYQQRRRHQNKTQMERRKPLINKQKSSQSFIIKKKFNSNVIELQKQEPEKFSNRFTYVMQKYRKDHFVKEDNLKDFLESPYEVVVKSSQSPRDHESLVDEKTKEVIRKEHKQLKKKENHLKGGRSLKVRVNKLIKAQQNFFNSEKASGESRQKQRIIIKTEHNEPKKQGLRYHTEEYIELAVLQKPVKIAQSPQVEEFDACVNFKDGNSIVMDYIDLKEKKTSSSEELLKSSSNVGSQKKILNNNSNLLKVKNERESENGSNLKNRKSRIASIRAIKNYIKRHDNEEKSPCPPQQKEIKQIGTVKKREKQTSCLTHKIKWGNLSKKKLNSDRGIDITLNQFLHECSVEGKIKPEAKRFQREFKIKEKEDEQINIIESQIQDPKTKKKPFRVQFAENKGQTVKTTESSDERIPEADKKSDENLEKKFTETLKSKKPIDGDNMIQRACSKQLIGFEDPGISLIANNNDSIHIADTRLILPSFDRLSFKALEIIDQNMISPVAMMKRVKQDPVEIEQRMESLQELYCELKSHKQFPFKVDQELPKFDSLQALCQNQ